MLYKDFSSESPGRLIKNLEGNWAFLPHPLPPGVAWDDGLVSAISRAESALGRLSGLGHKFPRPRRLVRLFLRREAELSSRIENTCAGVRTQLLFDLLPDVQRQSPDVEEVDNNFRALELGLKAIRSRPLSLHLIKQMHQVLLRGVRGQDKTPGNFRTIQAHIGRTQDIREARFVPPPPHAITGCMDGLEQFIQQNESVPRIARLAMIHYQFEAIHPFADGNGRIGRVLILLLMFQMDLLPLPLFNPSAHLERNRSAYYDHLLNVSLRGAWQDWIRFFCTGIVEECSETIRRVEALDALRRKYQARIRETRSSAKLAQLADELFGRPRVTLSSVQSMLDVGHSSAQRYIDKLLDLRILREVTGGQRNRVYLAHEIVEQFSTAEPARRRTKLARATVDD